MADAVRQVPVPNAALSHSTLDHVDYADAFVVETGAAQDHTAEEWARVILEGAPIAVKSALVSGWTALGLKLGSPTSTERVLGWEVRRSTRGLALLGAGARTGLSGELLVRRQRRAVAFSTFVQLDNPAARAMWAGIERGHQVVVRRMLEQAELAPGLARSGA